MKFGKLKCKILSVLSEEYKNNNKENIGKILKLIKEDKNFKELYLFYEDFEKLSIKEPKQYLDNLKELLNNKFELVTETSNKIEKLLPKNIEYEYNSIYEGLDLLGIKFDLNNIVKKNESIELLENHLISEKEVIIEEGEINFTTNEKLLKTILVNNFNILYENNLDEAEKKLFKEIISINESDLNNNFNLLKEEILKKLDVIILENNDQFLNEKIKEVKKQVLSNNEVNKLNYLKLKDLSNEII
jgi:hypothetical protein